MTKKLRKQYTEKFKREAVKLVTEKGDKVSEAARKPGVHVSLLRRRKERLQAEEKGERPNADERLYATRDEAKQDLIDYVEMFHNSWRKRSYLGYSSPSEFEDMAKVA